MLDPARRLWPEGHHLGIGGAEHQAPGVKIGRLLSLGLDEALIGPVLELLASDGRVRPVLPTANGVANGVTNGTAKGIIKEVANGVNGINGAQ